MMKNKRLLAVLIVLATIFVFSISYKTKQMLDRYDHLNHLVESQSDEINQLRSLVDEHEAEIDDLKSKIEELESER